MSLDSDARKYMELENSAMKESLQGMDIELYRKAAIELALGSERERMESIADHEITGDGLFVREYVPPRLGSTGAILLIHGGGFVFGSVEEYDPFARALSNQLGTRIFSVEYRLAPEYPFPSGAEDCVLAYEWLLSRADTFGISPDDILLLGDSAGGALCGYVSRKSVLRRIKKPAGQVLLYPMIGDPAGSESMRLYDRDYLLRSEDIEWFLRQYLQSQEHRLNPDFILTEPGQMAGYPATMVISAEFDPLRDSGESYASALMESGVRCISLRANGMVHGFMTNYELIPQSRLYLEMEGTFARSCFARSEERPL